MHNLIISLGEISQIRWSHLYGGHAFILSVSSICPTLIFIDFNSSPRNTIYNNYVVVMCGYKNEIISLMILTIKNTKKTKKIKALQKTKLVLFPSCILSCKQEWVHYTKTFWHKYPPTNHRKDTTLNWCLKVRTWGGGYLAALIVCPTLGRWHEPNAMLTFNHHVYSVFGFSLDSYEYWWQIEIVICGSHWFTKHNTQIGIIPSSPFKDKSVWEQKTQEQ